MTEPAGPALQAIGVSLSFSGFKALRDCTVEVQRGAITGLIGPNGAGKTTLFNILAGAYTPTSGQVILDGQDITALRPDQRFARGLARTFQIPQEFATMSVVDNLLAVPAQPSPSTIWSSWFGRNNAHKAERIVLEKADKTLAFLNLSHVRDVPAGNLSGGQRKLLEIGRCLMSDCKIILLDEPAAGVNRTLLVDIAARIRDLNALGYTFLIVEHDLDFLQSLASHIYVMAEGSVLVSGTMDDIRKIESVKNAYLGTDVGLAREKTTSEAQP